MTILNRVDPGADPIAVGLVGLTDRLPVRGALMSNGSEAVRLDVLGLYDQIIATQPDVKRKGATMPYTSQNGHMFSFLTPEGHLALRLPSPERQAFLASYHTRLCEQHGKVLEEYVEVPDSLLRNVDELAQHFRTSYAYVSSLKPKRTTRPTNTSGSA